MYGVLYAYTPEVFPAPHRGTGDALCSAFNRFTGILAPVIKIATTSRNGNTSSIGPNAYVDIRSHVWCFRVLNLDLFRPVFVSASLFIVAAFFATLLPIEVCMCLTLLKRKIYLLSAGRLLGRPRFDSHDVRVVVFVHCESQPQFGRWLPNFVLLGVMTTLTTFGWWD